MKKCLLVWLLALPISAQAELIGLDDYGFEVKIEHKVAVSNAKAYQQFLNVGQWWNGEHTWFGQSKNLSIDPRAGGCFCEIDGNKQAMHMQVSYVDPNNELRMTGGLGPLQMLGVYGGMSWQFKKIDATSSTIIFNYKVIGTMEGGLKPLAPVVDKVLNIQLAGLVDKINKG